MIKVSEIFGPTVQGEGPLIGKPTVFVRTGGCDYRCTWCDTLYAVLPEYSNNWTAMSAKEILDQVKELSGGKPILVTLTGGNPAMHKLGPLIELGKGQGFTFSLETQGSLPRKWFGKLDWLFLSPKPPSSHETPDWAKFEKCISEARTAKLALKVAVFDKADYEFAKTVENRFPDVPLYLQVGNDLVSGGTPFDLNASLTTRYQWLVDQISKDLWFTPTLLPQLHVLVWGNDRGH